MSLTLEELERDLDVMNGDLGELLSAISEARVSILKAAGYTTDTPHCTEFWIDPDGHIVAESHETDYVFSHYKGEHL